MKKLFFILTLALVSFGLSAQDGLKGTWFAGGQLSFGSSEDKNLDSKITNTTVLPIAGTFITPDIAIGAGIGYMGSKNKVDGETIGKTSSFVFKPLVRKYWNISGGLYFFGQAALPVFINSGETKGVDYDGTSFSLQLAPGFDYVVNSWLTIETSFTIFDMGYSRKKYEGAKASSDFGFNANPFNSVGDRTVGELQVGVKFLF